MYAGSEIDSTVFIEECEDHGQKEEKEGTDSTTPDNRKGMLLKTQ